MKSGRKAELLFEEFLAVNGLPFQRLEEGPIRVPDYIVNLPGTRLIVEVSAVDKKHVGEEHKVRRKTVGDAVRAKIKDKSGQLRWDKEGGMPSLLLLSEEEDAFGFSVLEDLDFTTAMYGELTLEVNRETRSVSRMFNGRNELLTSSSRTHISALGRLAKLRNEVISLSVFPNIFAERQLSRSDFPECFEFREVCVE